MSNVHEEYEDETGESAGKDPVRSHLRKVEHENKLLRQQAAEFETLKREMAFTKAGIDLNVPMAKYFVKVTKERCHLKQSGKPPKKQISFSLQSSKTW